MSEAMMNSGMHKPPVAPKPTVVQAQTLRPGLSPATPRRHVSFTGTQKKPKPALAPKPCLSKLTTAVESKPLASKSLLNFQNGIQQENKKPDWDYIIPICLCSEKNCKCLISTPAHKDKITKLPPTSRMDNSDKRADNAKNQVLSNDHDHKDKGLPGVDNSGTSMNVRLPLPHRTLIDEVNGKILPQSAPGQGLEGTLYGSEQRKPLPVPVPRKPRTPVLPHQEKVGDKKEQFVSHKGRGTSAGEVKVSSEGKSSSSLSVSELVNESRQSHFLSPAKACTPPAAPTKKKPFQSSPEKGPTSVSLPKKVRENDQCWDSNIYKMEVSVNKADKEVQKGQRDESLPHFPISSSLLTQQKLRPPPAIPVAGEKKKPVKVAPLKPLRSSSPIVPMQRKESSEENEGKYDTENRHVPPTQDYVLKDSVLRELPLPPYQKTQRNHLPAKLTRSSQSSLCKQRAKSFSGADIIRSEGQRRSSFRKFLDTKLSVRKLMVGGQNPDDANDGEQSVDTDPGETFTYPLIGVEQSVDEVELCPGAAAAEEEAVYYEDVCHYEDIPEYMNVQVGKGGSFPQGSFQQPVAWHSEMYNDEGIYEEQEPYTSFEKDTEHQQYPTQTAYDRISFNEEGTPEDGGPSDDDIMSKSSDEEDGDESSSISSKGEPEQPEKSVTENGQKKSKIHYIAEEIMSSEHVFVDVLKLLHVDFRDAVSKASCQSGKPVIEEQILNQILYYLPQLYELNCDLLKELQKRVDKWDENAQLADIFLKKGPYLKMYSTYIREYDKNVTLLEEQTKKNSAFAAVVQEFEASPRCANLALKHYLLKPVQRIPQYRLLLTDYLKNLPEDSNDYKDTQAALALVKDVANHANDIMKQGDNFQKVIRVQCSLIGHHELVEPGRVHLKEGVLMKLSRKIMQPRMFFLFNDVLLYTTPVQSGQYKLKNKLPLAGMKVSKPSQEAFQHELTLESVERSFILSASSPTERDEWLEAISTAINDHTRKKISFISGKPPEEVDLAEIGDGAPLGSKAPVWIPDPRATMCMICTCEFSLTWRRHHCRACGKVVCQSCSSNKQSLEYLKNETARVCDQCFAVLVQQTDQRSPTEALGHGNRATFAFSRKHKKIPAALKEVSANTHNSSMSGYLQRSKGNKKQGRRLWFVIKDKVLYTYAASEDVAALESQPLLGFMLKVDSSQKLKFKLYHKNILYYIFKADDVQTAQRWISSFKEATVL